MKFDIHTHHYRCGHAEGNIRDYIESAISSGLQVIGISDHSPYFAKEEDMGNPGVAMGKSEMEGYVQEVLQLKQEYAGTIDVLLGMESDYFPDHVELYRNTFAKYPFDYIIGSVHHVYEDSIFNKDQWIGLDSEQQLSIKKEYYRLIQGSAKSGLFQVLGHIDAMKGNYPGFSDIPAAETIDETLQVIASCGVAIEINTSGRMKLSGGWYPSDDILERALHYGVDVTFGSDSHHPNRIGDDFSKVSAKLREIGFKEWVYYKQKQKQIVSLL